MDRTEFRVTICNDTKLLARLAGELRALVQQLREAWPAIRRDPVGFVVQAGKSVRETVRRAQARPHTLTAFATAVLILVSGAILLVLIDRARVVSASVANEEPALIVEFLPLPATNPNPEGRGVGAGANGRVGFKRGSGEGSAPAPRKSSGGGGGGNGDPLPAPHGGLPAPAPVPAAIPKFPPPQKQTLAVAGIDIDPALWRNVPIANYGESRAQATTPSNGSGNGGGMGNGNGTGVGDGTGAGVGAGEGGNIGGNRNGLGCCGPGGSNGGSPDDDPDRVYPGLQVTERARVISKPEPQYTEDARRNQVTGAVVLRVVFSRSGEVTNIRAIHPLPFGLTEKAIAAARMIRFRPATKAGRPVNVYMQLEYNFNLY